MYVDPPSFWALLIQVEAIFMVPPLPDFCCVWVCPCVHVPGNSPGNEVVAGVCQLEILGVLEKMQLTTSHVLTNPKNVSYICLGYEKHM